ncbi:MAG: DNA polymerase IV [Chitinophagaceae bacterium]
MYEARRFGVHSAMPMKTALRICPQAIVVKGSRGEYSKYSRWITEMIEAKAPLVEKASIDEFYLDLSGMEKYFDPFQFAIALRQEIIDTTQLPISFGLASSKMVAKIATDAAKPNGYLQILSGKESAFLAPLPVDKIPGIGQHMNTLLQQCGIQTIGDVLRWSQELLLKQFGNFGAELWEKAQGIDAGEVQPYTEAKSISTESTFEVNIVNEEELMDTLVQMTEKVAHELRQENKMTGCLTVKIRYPDFQTTTRQSAVDYTCYDDELIPAAKELFRRLYRSGTPVRLLGVRFSELTDGALQTNLFSDTLRKQELYKAIDEVKDRFGRDALTKAAGK